MKRLTIVDPDLPSTSTRFKPGSPGRRPGSINHTTKVLRDAIILAASTVGRDRNGKGGLAGYCEMLAIKHPREFSTLLGKVLPLQLHTKGETQEHIFRSSAEVRAECVARGLEHFIKPPEADDVIEDLVTSPSSDAMN
jgi:hypothetical protein